MAELAEQFELHPNQIIQFRQHAVENMAGLFAKDGGLQTLWACGGGFKGAARQDWPVDPGE